VLKVGVWLAPQHTDVSALRRAWRECDALGVDSIWVWDHFFPLTGDPAGTHFEGWTLLAAMAVETSRARIGVLVSNHEYRNPDLLADMARTVDHLSGGRVALAVGAGWFERDYEEYGYPFRSGPERARSTVEAVRRIDERIARLNPPPLGELPLMIAGDGPGVMLRLAAERARMWNTMAWRFAEGGKVLDDWCDRLGRDPGEIERSCFITDLTGRDQIDDLRAAGAEHVILQLHHPFDLGPVRELLRHADREPAR
jgi:probable F420-dependent oxidoreductase